MAERRCRVDSLGRIGPVPSLRGLRLHVVRPLVSSLRAVGPCLSCWRGAVCHLNFRADLSAWCFSVRCPKRLSALPQLALLGEELPCDTEEILHGGEVEVRCQGVWPEAVAEARAAEEHFRLWRGHALGRHLEAPAGGELEEST